MNILQIYSVIILTGLVSAGLAWLAVWWRG